MLYTSLCFIAKMGRYFASILLLWLWVLLPASFAYAHALDLSAPHMQHAQRALYAVHQHRYETALEHANATKSPVAPALIQWLYYVDGRRGVSFDAIRQFILQHPDWPNMRLLRQRAEQALRFSDDPHTVISWFESYPPLTSKGRWILAYAYQKTDAKHHRSTIDKLVKESWRLANFSYKEERDFLKQFKDRLTVDDHVARVDRLLWDERVTQAQRTLRRIKTPKYRKLFTARIYLIRNAPGLDAAIAAIPDSLKDDPGLLYARLKWRDRHHKEEGVIALLETLPDDLPRAELFWPLLHKYARTLMRQEAYQRAYELVIRHQTSDAKSFSEAEWLAGWLALRKLDHPDRAFSHFDAMYQKVRYPISRSRGAYWLARAAEAGGKTDIAAAWYGEASSFPTTFYGQLALLRQQPEATYHLPLSPDYTNVDTTAFHNNTLMQAAHLLVKLGNAQKARLFIRRAFDEASSDGERFLITQYGLRVGRPDLSVKAGSHAHRQGLLFIDSRYPVISVPEVERQEQVLAVIRQESHFYADANSHAGAVGLMQVTPSTARLVSRKAGLKYSSRRLRRDPYFNMKLGSFYIRHLHWLFDQSSILAFAAYNAGPGNVKKWLSAYGDPRELPSLDDKIDWIETIPFSETRNYVQRVLESSQVYYYLLAAQDERHITLEYLQDKLMPKPRS